MSEDRFTAVDRPKVVVTGASGNVGAGVLRALTRHLPNAEIVGICRRPPSTGGIYDGVCWHAVNLASPSASADLEPAMRGADVVIHLALAVQPVRDTNYLYRANVLGTQAVLRAMNAAGVRQMVYASSLGIYAPGGATPVSENWSDAGQRTSTYSQHKVLVERLLDRFVNDHPETVVARFRPTVVVQREAASLIRSLYLGPYVPQAVLKLLQSRRVPILPLPKGIALQFVHADDVGDAVIRLMQRRAHGSFNIAADVLDSPCVGRTGRSPAGRSEPHPGPAGDRFTEPHSPDRSHTGLVRRGHQHTCHGYVEGTPRTRLGPLAIVNGECCRTHRRIGRGGHRDESGHGMESRKGADDVSKHSPVGSRCVPGGLERVIFGPGPRIRPCRCPRRRGHCGQPRVRHSDGSGSGATTTP